MNNIAALMPLMMNAFMAGDTTLSQLLSAEDYSTVKKHFQDIGLPMMLVERIKPMFLSAMAGGESFNPLDGGANTSSVSY